MFVLRRLLFTMLLLVIPAGAQELKIAAAADLTPAMQKLGASFEKQTGIRTTFSFGSSGNFFMQIRNGAPFDVFLSADRSYPDTLDNFGKTDQGPMIYAIGKLVAWYSNRVKLDLAPGDVHALTSPVVKKIAIANPEHAPYGRAAVAALVHFKVYDEVKPKLVLGENVSQAAAFAQSGNAEVAMIPQALAVAEAMQKSGHYVVVDPYSYPPLYQSGVVLRGSQNKRQAHQFLEFLRSPEGQKILHDYGFETPPR